MIFMFYIYQEEFHRKADHNTELEHVLTQKKTCVVTHIPPSIAKHKWSASLGHIEGLGIAHFAVPTNRTNQAK